MSAATDRFPTLFSPLRVGGITVRNRVVNLPQGMGYTNRGRVEDEDIEYHRRRALGGVGLVITGGTATHPTSQDRTRNFVELYDPDVVTGLRRRSDAVHDAGAHIVGQIFNLGRYMAADAMTVAPIGPSAVRAPGVRFAPMEMGAAEIDEVVEGFRRSARHLRDGGCDGVEIHGAHGYLLAQFLSAATNRRDDAYGGDAVGRARLLVEIAAAVRADCGPDFVVGVRLSADDEVPGGTTVEECQENAARLLDQVQIDYVSLAVGLRGTYVKDSSADEGAALSRIAEVGRGLSVPVVAAQRLRRPETAEQVLLDGTADLIGMARALIADPDWAAKAQRGDAHRIRLCVGDVQDCRAHLSGGLRCMVNADVGREVVAASRIRSRPVASLSVIGGGPAGLEVARRAAERGVAVTVYEAAQSPGGQLRLAAGMPGRTELLDFVTYLTGELRASGVEIEYGAELDLDSATALTTDAVVVATGARGAAASTWTASIVSDGSTVRTVWDVLNEASSPLDRSRVVVLDDGRGDWPALGAAARLAAAGAAVTVMSPAGSILAGVPGESQAGVRSRLLEAGVRWMVDIAARSIGASAVDLERQGTGERFSVPADLAVVATGLVPVDGLWRTLRTRRAGVFVVGDAETPRTVGNAVRGAARVVEQLNSAHAAAARQ